jgi:hypothetical protein
MPVVLVAATELAGAAAAVGVPWLARACMPRMPTSRAATRGGNQWRPTPYPAVSARRTRLRGLTAMDVKGFIVLDDTEPLVSRQVLGP